MPGGGLHGVLVGHHARMSADVSGKAYVGYAWAHLTNTKAN